MEMRAEQAKCWPAEQRAAVDRSADPLGSYRSDSGFYLNPARHAETVQAIGRVREAEPGISADVQATERDNSYGGWLEGFGKRLKGEDRLKEKVAEVLEVEPEMTATPTGVRRRRVHRRRPEGRLQLEVHAGDRGVGARGFCQ